MGLLLLAVAIASIFAANARLVTDEPAAFGRMLAPLALFFLLTYLLSQAIARRLRAHRAERVTLTMTSMARNSPIAVAIAAAAFPDRPLIALALVVGPLVELPVLAVVARLQSADLEGL